ncbi:MAG: c-type cytochrome [Candidatus Bipolaricaulia bacterium]
MTFANTMLWLTVVVILGLFVYELVLFSQGFSAPDPREEESIVDPYAELSSVAVGQLVFEAQGCQACHLVDLKGGSIGPSLDHVAIRRNAEWIKGHVTNPRKDTPGTFMRSFALSDQELDDLAEFLGTFTADRQGPASAGEVMLDPPERFTADQVERGKQLFRTSGCIACHRIGSEGGVIGPNLTHEAQRLRTDEWHVEHLKNPVSVYVFGPPPRVSWPMPGFDRLSDEDLIALVAYLQSLK